MAKHTITIEVDEDCLRELEDGWLAAYWVAMQASQAPRHDKDACRLVSSLGNEIIRRWLDFAPALQYEVTADGYAWDTLRRNGHWPGPERVWVYEPGKAEREAAADKERA